MSPAIVLVALMAGSGQAADPPPTSGDVPVVDPRLGRSRIAMTFTYPGVGLRYFPAARWAAEAYGQYEPGDTSVLVAGGRVARYFDGWAGIFPYAGVDAGYAQYVDDLIEGTGYLAGGFAGLEWFLHPRVSLQADAGPMLVRLQTARPKLAEQGMELVVNAGITFYLTGVRPRSPRQ